MRRISSKTTYLYKRVFPLIWFGFLLLFVGVSLVSGAHGLQMLPFLIGPVFMAGFGYFIMKKLVFDLVDEVTDLGDALLVKNGNREERIALSNITNVNYSPLVSPPRVTLSLRQPGIFGKQVTFCAPVRFVPFSPSPIIGDLIQRIDSTRRR